MGEKKVSIRTLVNGDKVRHHPDGTQQLLAQNKLAARLDTHAPALAAASAAGLKARLAIVEEKRARQLSGNPVPRDKMAL